MYAIYGNIYHQYTPNQMLAYIYIPAPWILWVCCRMIFPEGMGMEMALFQQALFLFTFLEVLLPNRNEPQTPINSQIGHTHKQTNWGNDNPISGGESCSSWCSWTRSISGNPAMPAGNILAERLQDLRSHQSVAYQNMSTRQNLNRDVVAKKDCEILDSRHMAT